MTKEWLLRPNPIKYYRKVTFMMGMMYFARGGETTEKGGHLLVIEGGCRTDVDVLTTSLGANISLFTQTQRSSQEIITYGIIVTKPPVTFESVQDFIVVIHAKPIIGITQSEEGRLLKDRRSTLYDTFPSPKDMIAYSKWLR